MNTEKKNSSGWLIVISATMMILGCAVIMQIKSTAAQSTSLESQSTETLVSMVRSLNDYRNNLESELEQLNIINTTLDTSATLERQIQQLEIFTGAIAVQGDGVSITITGDYDIYNFDIIDILNELKVTGAEAMAVNNIRYTTTSRLTQEIDLTGQIYVAIDGERLLTPIVITAIGDPSTLEKGLTFTGGIIDNLNTLYSIYPIIRQETGIVIPAATINTNVLKLDTVTN